MNDDLFKPNVDLVIEKLKHRTCEEHNAGVEFIIEGDQVAIKAPCCDKFRDDIQAGFINELNADKVEREMEYSKKLFNDAISRLKK